MIEMAGTLFLVGTPIGNLKDISARALDTLEAVDFIAAEDTRVSVKLLTHYGIKKPLISYFEHNRREQGAKILDKLLAGESGALVTDAGMPAISDPGQELVELCTANGVPVTVVPGPTAMASAVALSGFPCGRFTFEGFLSVNKKSRREHLAGIVEEPRMMVFYEAPHKLINTLRDLYAALGDRKIALCREITKLHEETVRTTLSQAVGLYDEEHPPKGEFVLVVEGAPPKEEEAASPEDAAALMRAYLDEGMSPTEAAKRAAKETGLRKSEVYKLVKGSAN
jgi:16S rRNA (cytidine1402-2'-O)-methyltransferase